MENGIFAPKKAQRWKNIRGSLFGKTMRRGIAGLLAALLLSAGTAVAAADTVADTVTDTVTDAASVGSAQTQLSNFVKINVYDGAFSDIDGHWAAQNIASAYEYGIISGIGGGRYDPDGTLTAAQAIIIAARLHMAYQYPTRGQEVLDGYASSSSPSPLAAYYAYALGERLIADEWGGRLDDAVTRGETVYLWSKILRPEDMESRNVVNSLPDVTLSTPYFAEISQFYEAGIVQGSSIGSVQNNFNPGGVLSRAEAATMFITLVEAEKRISGKTYGSSTVQLLAGSGTSGFSDKAAPLSSFALPYGLTADGSGAIVVFDTYNNAVRRIYGGQTQTLAGRLVTQDTNGFSRGFYRDGDLSIALFNRPSGGVYGANGSLYICDSENHVIRMVKDGKAYTFAGTTQGYADGPGSAAQFNTPMAVAIDKNGNLYVADALNDCIRKIDPTGRVSTIAGTAGRSGYGNGASAAALFRSPSGIAVNEDGSTIYVSDTGNHLIRKIENGQVSTLSGVTAQIDEEGDPMGGFQNGTAVQAMFNLPKGITLAGDVLFVADSGNNVIRAVNLKGDAFTVAGTGEPGDSSGGILAAEFNQPAGVLWHRNALYVADTTNNVIKTLLVDLAMYKEVAP